MSKIQRVKIRPAIEEYMQSDRVLRQSEGTRKHRARTLKILAEMMDGLGAYEMTARHVDQTLARLRETRAECTLNIDRNNLRAFERWLHDSNLLSPWARPTADLKHVPEDAHAKTLESLILTPEQAKDALEVASRMHPRERMIVALGLYGFLRESEMVILQWKDVHLSEGFIEFRRPKQRKAYHKIPILGGLRPELEKWRAWLEEHHGPIQDTDYVIPARRAAGRYEPMNPNFPVRPSVQTFELTPNIKPVLEAVGFVMLKGAGIHTFRRTGACHYYDQTRSLAKVQRMLGHKDTKTTERYLKHRDWYADLEDGADEYDPYDLVPEQDEQSPSNVLPFRRVS